MLKAFLSIGGLQVLTLLVLLVRTKGLALLLGPEQVGVMSVVDRLIALFAQGMSLSLPFAALRFLPSRWERGEAEFRDLLRRMQNVLGVTTLGAVAIGLTIVTLRPGWFGQELLPFRAVVLMAFLALPATVFIPFAQNVIAGSFRHNRAMVFALANAVVFTVTALVGVALWGLRGLYALYGVGGLLLAWWVHRRVGGRGRARFSLRLPAQMWRFSAALLVLTILAPYAALFVNYRVLDCCGPQTAGWMQAAVGISISVRTVLGAAHPVFYTPLVNRQAPAAVRMNWANDFQKTLWFIIGILVPPLLLFPHLAVSVLYSTAFRPGATFVLWFVIAEIVMLFAGTYQGLVIAFDRMGYHVAQNVVAQLLVIGMAAVLIPRFGILGAGLATTTGAVFLFVATARYLRSRFELRIPARLLGLGGFVLAALLGCGLLGSALPQWSWTALGIKAAAYAVSVAGLAQFLTRADRGRVRELAGHAYQRLAAVRA